MVIDCTLPPSSLMCDRVLIAYGIIKTVTERDDRRDEVPLHPHFLVRGRRLSSEMGTFLYICLLPHRIQDCTEGLVDLDEIGQSCTVATHNARHHFCFVNLRRRAYIIGAKYCLFSI